MSLLETFFRYELNVTFIIELLVPALAWAIVIAPPRRGDRRETLRLAGCTLLMAAAFFAFRLFCVCTMSSYHYLLARIVFHGVLSAILFFSRRGNRTQTGFGVWCSMYAGSLSLLSIGGQLSMVWGAFHWPGAVQSGTRVLFDLLGIPLAIYLDRNRLDQYENIPKGGLTMVVSGAVCLLAIRCMEAFWFSTEYRQKVFFAVAYICVFILVMCSVYAVNNICRERTKSMELNAEKQRALIEKEMAQFSKAQLEELRSVRHEIKNQNAYMRILIEQARYDELLTYFDNTSGTLKKALETIDCGNTQLNTILNMERRKAEAADVPLTFDIVAAETLPYSEDDLCSLLSNMIDNGLDECQRLRRRGAQAPGVSVTIRPKNAYLYIQVRNPTDRTALDPWENGLRTTKKDKTLHGYGTRIIRRVAEKYNGCAQYRIEDGIFTAQAMLELDRKMEDDL